MNDELGKRQKKVFDAILRLYMATDREIAEYLGYDDPNKVRPRRNELLRSRLIVDVGVRKCKVSGKTATIWRVNPLYTGGM